MSGASVASDRYRMKTVAVEVSCDRLVEFVWTRSIFGDSAWHLCRWSRLVRSTDAETRYRRPCSSSFPLVVDVVRTLLPDCDSIWLNTHENSRNRSRNVCFMARTFRPSTIVAEESNSECLFPGKIWNSQRDFFYTWKKTENSLEFFLNSLW